MKFVEFRILQKAVRLAAANRAPVKHYPVTVGRPLPAAAVPLDFRSRNVHPGHQQRSAVRTGVGLNVLTALAQTLSAFAHVFVAGHRTGSADAPVVLAEAERSLHSREMVAVVVAAEIEAHFRRVDIFSVYALGEFVLVTLGKILLRILGPVVVVAAVDARR